MAWRRGLELQWRLSGNLTRVGRRRRMGKGGRGERGEKRREMRRGGDREGQKMKKKGKELEDREEDKGRERVNCPGPSPTVLS